MSETLLSRIRTIAMDALEVSTMGDTKPDPAQYLDMTSGQPTDILRELGYNGLAAQADMSELVALVIPNTRGCSRGGETSLLFPLGGMDPVELRSILGSDFDVSFHLPAPEGDLSARWRMVHRKLALCVAFAIESYAHAVSGTERWLRYNALIDSERLPTRAEFDKGRKVDRATEAVRLALDSFPGTELLSE